MYELNHYENPELAENEFFYVETSQRTLQYLLYMNSTS
jgi:hypothetical protein